jgi:hypothetical protein
MPIAGLVAGALCASVGWMVVTRGLRTTLVQRQLRQDAERALVSDCLANVDRVIEAPSFERVAPARVIDLRTFEPLDPDHVIDLSNVQPRNRSLAVPPSPPSLDAIILEPPSIWRVPTTPARRSVAATA